MEYMLKHEAAVTAGPDKGEFDKLKSLLFTNLAIANMKLGNHEGCFKCCNIAIVFCNDPGLLLQAISDYDEDTNMVDKDATLKLPIENKDFVTIATKIMFRRGKCYQETFDYQLALEDFRMAYSISPIKVIEGAIAEVVELIGACDGGLGLGGADREKLLLEQSKRKKRALKFESSDGSSDEQLQALMRNGGRCLDSQCPWAQTSTEATVYIPYSIVLSSIISVTHFDDKECEEGAVKPLEDATVSFEESEVFVRYSDKFILLMNMALEHNICPASSSYKICDVGKTRFLVLVLRKQPSREPFAGSEWWDRVFPQDEPVDTAACTDA